MKEPTVNDVLFFFAKAVLLAGALIMMCYGAVLVAAGWFGL